MNKTFPNLIQQIHEHHKFDLDKFLSCGIPFIKLAVDVPDIDEAEFKRIEADVYDWRTKWGMVQDNYQTNQWNGTILFGPTDWEKWMLTIEEKGKKLEYDEDALAGLYRHTQPFEWTVPENNVLRNWVSKIFPDDNNINMVNIYTLPPGGWLFPHIDNNPNPRLNKIYVTLNWPEGNYFGFNGFGNMPVQGKSAWLINNYRYSHWVYNDSDETRLVMAVAANLSSISDLIENSWINMLTG
jgi:hypothetical protein